MAKVLATATFQKQSTRLAKKYSSLRDELSTLHSTLQNNPTLGVPLGKNCFKIRIAVKSKGKGKRGGMRVITHAIVSVEPPSTTDVVQESTVYLLAIYDKSEQETVTDADVQYLLREIVP